MIKSGGEWISSIELENIAVGHPAVAEAAVIGVSHPKWNERPLLIVVKKQGASVTRDELLAFYEGKVAKWCDAGRRRVRRRAAAHGDRQAVEKNAARAIQGNTGCRLPKEPLNNSRAGATGSLPGMMARSKAKQISRDICEPSDKASAPASPVPKGWRENAAPAAPASSVVVRTTTFVVRLAFIRISRQRAPRGSCSEVP